MRAALVFDGNRESWGTLGVVRDRNEGIFQAEESWATRPISDIARRPERSLVNGLTPLSNNGPKHLRIPRIEAALNRRREEETRIAGAAAESRGSRSPGS